MIDNIDEIMADFCIGAAEVWKSTMSKLKENGGTENMEYLVALKNFGECLVEALSSVQHSIDEDITIEGMEKQFTE